MTCFPCRLSPMLAKASACVRMRDLGWASGSSKDPARMRECDQRSRNEITENKSKTYAMYVGVENETHKRGKHEHRGAKPPNPRRGWLVRVIRSASLLRTRLTSFLRKKAVVGWCDPLEMS